MGIETLGLIINTEINAFKQSRQELLECQVLIDRAGNPSLDHDSYVDCSCGHYEDTDSLRRQLVADIAGIKDMVSDQVRAEVIEALNASFVLEKVEKQRLIQNLSY